MAIKDASEVLRKAINGVLDEETNKKIPVIADDLTNIVEIGTDLTGFEKVAVLGEMCNLIAKQTFYSDKYIDTAPNIMVDEDSFNAIVQVNRVSLENSDFDKNLKYSGMFGNNEITFNDMYGSHFPSVSSKYFSNIVSDSFPVTYTEDQIKQAFLGANELNTFYDAVRSAVETRKKTRSSFFNYATFACGIADIASEGERVIQFADAANGDYKNTVKQIRKAIREMRKYSGKFSSFTTSTSSEELTLYISADLYDELANWDRNAFNPDKFDLTGVKIEVRPDWYYNADLATHPEDIICKCHKTTPDTDGSYYATVVKGIKWVLMSNRFMGTTRRNDEAIATPNTLAHRTNINYQSEYEARVNTDFPILICLTDTTKIYDVDVNDENFDEETWTTD